MKVLHISNGDDRLGSGRCLMELLSYEITYTDITPVVINPTENGITDFCKKNCIEYHVVPYKSFMYAQHDRLSSVKFFIRKLQYIKLMDINKLYLRLLNEVDFESIDLIHTNNCTIDLGKRLSEITRIQHIWHLREGGLDQWDLRPFVTHLINYMTCGDVKFIAVSQSVKTEWANIGINEKIVDVAYDGVRNPQNLLINSNLKSTDTINFILSGTISESKGQMRVIEALKLLEKSKLDKIHVDFWGAGNQQYVQLVNDHINKSGLKEIVTFRGFTNNIWEELYKYDCGINASYKEAFGRSTVEYMMMGLPVIASNTGSGPELIDDSSKGCLFEHNNAYSLMQAFSYIIDNISTYRQQKEYLSEYAISKYSDKASAKRVVEIFETVHNKR